MKTQSSQERALTLPQVDATCWFNALLESLILSDKGRELCEKTVHKDRKSKHGSARAYLQRLLSFPRFAPDEEAVKSFYSTITKHPLLEFLDALHTEHPQRFPFHSAMQNIDGGFDSSTYIVSFLHWMFAHSHLRFKVLNYYGPNTFSISHLHFLKLGQLDQNNMMITVPHQSTYNQVSQDLTDPQDVIVVLVQSRSDQEFDKGAWLNKGNFLFKNTVRLSPDHCVLHVGEEEYLLDAQIVSNLNEKDKHHLRHTVCCVTCNTQEYVYNGWYADTKEASHLHMELPCSLMPFEWKGNVSEEMCLLVDQCVAAELGEVQRQTTRPTSYICFDPTHQTKILFFYPNK